MTVLEIRFLGHEKIFYSSRSASILIKIDIFGKIASVLAK